MKIVLPFRPSPGDSPEKTDFALLAYRYVWLEMSALTLLWVSLSIAFPSQMDIWLTFYVPMVVGSFIGLLLNARGKTRATVIVLLVSGWTVFTGIALLYWQVFPQDLNRYIIIVVAAGLLLGKKAGFIAATVCGMTEIAFAILVSNGTIAASAQLFPEYTLLTHLFLLYLAAVIPAFATRRVRVALEIAEEEREERKRAEEISQANEVHYLTIVDNSPGPIVIHRDGRVVHANPAATALLRAGSPDKVIGKSVTDIVQPESSELFTLVLETQKTSTPSATREGKIVRFNGSVAEVETASVPGTLQGKPAIQTMIRDMTELKLLQEQMHLQIAALNSAANGIVITDRAGSIVWTNAAFQSLTGYVNSEAVGKNPRNLVKSGKQTKTFYRDMWDTILSGKVWRGELVNRRKDGTLYNESMTITPVTNETGAITHFVAVKQDITDRKLLEEQLLQSQKLDGIGQLAGGVAHDYNNILNVVVGYSELLKRKLGESDPARRSIDAILTAARRGADLTRQLLAFARKEIISPKVLNINTSIDSVRNMLHRIIGENLRLEFVQGKDLWKVKIDPTQFDQVLVNLVTNARDAIDDVGKITIRTSNVTITERNLPARSDLRIGDYVSVTLEDNGRGMDEKTLKRIFEPFFTTKPKGHGTGLGLSTVYGIVQQSGGAIEVRSQLGKGTVVTVFLPRYVEEIHTAEIQNPDESLRGTETVLVVEDQADLLNLAKTFLEEYGYNTITSLDPADAELLSEAYAGDIHLLLTDVVMPRMSGKELSQRLSRLRPGMRTLFMSGYGSDGLSTGENPFEGGDFIQKPFSLPDLARKIREVLSS